jgi:uncharacterized membrane protein
MHRELIQKVMGNHEAIVHFPIVLLTTTFLFGVIGILYKKALFKEILFWNLLIGLISLIAAVYSGLEGEKYIYDPFIRENLDFHIRNAWYATILFSGLILWLGIRKKFMQGMEYLAWLAIFFIASSAIIYEGTNGYEVSVMVKKASRSQHSPSVRKDLDYGWNF